MNLILLVGIVFISTLSRAAPVTVTIQDIKKVEITDSLTYPGQMESNINASLYADSDGVVKKIWKVLGDKVRRGEPLVTIKHTDPIYQYAPMVMSPEVSGVVSSIKVNEGSRVSKGELLATVTDPSKVRVIIEVAAQDLKSLTSGLVGEFKIFNSDKPIAVRIKGLSPFVDPGTGTATAQLEVIQSAELLPTPGLVGQVSFKVNRRMGILVPDYALVYKGNDTFVRLVQNSKSNRVPVVTGRKQRGQVEILSGITEGDTMVERASGFVANGEEVKIEKKSTAEN